MGAHLRDSMQTLVSEISSQAFTASLARSRTQILRVSISGSWETHTSVGMNDERLLRILDSTDDFVHASEALITALRRGFFALALTRYSAGYGKVSRTSKALIHLFIRKAITALLGIDALQLAGSSLV